MWGIPDSQRFRHVPHLIGSSARVAHTDVQPDAVTSGSAPNLLNQLQPYANPASTGAQQSHLLSGDNAPFVIDTSRNGAGPGAAGALELV